MVRLDTQRVWIDADHFEHLAESALRQRDVVAYENALAAYGGELLPEDRYADWCTERREYLRVLHIQLLLALVEAHEERGAHSASAARLREVLQHEPTREDAHRRLMGLYASLGARDEAMRQFHICETALNRELDLARSRRLSSSTGRSRPTEFRGRSQLPSPNRSGRFRFTDRPPISVYRLSAVIPCFVSWARRSREPTRARAA